MKRGSLPSRTRRILLESLAIRSEPVWLRTLAEEHDVPYGTAYGLMRQPRSKGWVIVTPEDRVGTSTATRRMYSITDAGREYLASTPAAATFHMKPKEVPMPDDYQSVTIQRGEPPLRVELPDEIGYVAIYINGVNPATRCPAICVEVVSATTHSPAADGRIYNSIYTARNDTVVLVGEPILAHLQQEQFSQRLADAIAAHDSGEHGSCPGTCPAVIAADVPRETPGE